MRLDAPPMLLSLSFSWPPPPPIPPPQISSFPKQESASVEDTGVSSPPRAEVALETEIEETQHVEHVEEAPQDLPSVICESDKVSV